MQANRIMLQSPGRIGIEPVTLGKPGAGEVLIEMRYSTISPGTELAWLHGLPNTPGEWPTPAGYCSCGHVREVGEGVEHVRVGDAVVTGASHASAAIAVAAQVAPLPAGLDLADARPYRLASIALQGVRKAQVQLGDAVAVLGLGVIGNLAGQIARAAGATRVVGIDPVDFRRHIATRCGYDAVVPSAVEALTHVASSGGFDVVIEATGAPEVVNDALHVARTFGRVVLLGSSRGETTGVNFYRDVHRKGVTILGAHDMTLASPEDIPPRFTARTDTRVVLELLAAGRIDGRPLISDTISWRDAAQAYDRLHARRENLMTISLDWSA